MPASHHHHRIESPSTASAVDHLTHAGGEQRRAPRLKLPAMYTLLRVRLRGEVHYRWTGHIYDISLSGMRFEVDEAIEPGTAIEIRAMLPGHRHTLFRAAGRVVRLHDDDPDAAPVRLAMTFEDFAGTIDHHRLSEYLQSAGMHRASSTRRSAA